MLTFTKSARVPLKSLFVWNSLLFCSVKVYYNGNMNVYKNDILGLAMSEVSRMSSLSGGKTHFNVTDSQLNISESV